MRPEQKITRLALFGAAPDTPNMGVSALFFSTVAGIAKYIDPVEFVVFDNGIGRRDSVLKMPDGKEIAMIRFGARGGRRYHRPENLATMLMASRLGRFGSWLNEGVRLVDSCSAVLDISGGDSFSDIYGRSRFDNIQRPKMIAINRGIPLILLPQTYGPYKNPLVRALASAAVCGASMAWARDEDSFAILKGLLGDGDGFISDIHLCGVDMAFSLPPSSARERLPTKLNNWLERKDPDLPLVGFNVSGLIYNDPEAASTRYHFLADYRQVVVDFLARVLHQTSARVVLISHVMDLPGHFESDLAACLDVAKKLGQEYEERVLVAPATLDQSQAKDLIAQMDWFCGTRMHSTIAGLSSGVPTASVSYSDKTRGVFETCGQGEHVMDPRKLTTDAVIEALWRSFADRESSRRSLADRIAKVKEQADRQAHMIVEHIHVTAKRGKG